jgi:hypothetical protein
MQDWDLPVRNVFLKVGERRAAAGGFLIESILAQSHQLCCVATLYSERCTVLSAAPRHSNWTGALLRGLLSLDDLICLRHLLQPNLSLVAFLHARVFIFNPGLECQN